MVISPISSVSSSGALRATWSGCFLVSSPLKGSWLVKESQEWLTSEVEKMVEWIFDILTLICAYLYVSEDFTVDAITSCLSIQNCCYKYSPPCPFLLLSHVFTFHSPSRVVYGSILTLLVLWLALDTAQRGTRQVVSFFGLIFFVLLMLMFSRHPFRVRHTTPAMPLHSPNAFSNPLANTFSFFVHTVALEMFGVGHRTTVCLGPDNIQDSLRGRGTEVVGRSSWGTLCHSVISGRASVKNIFAREYWKGGSCFLFSLFLSTVLCLLSYCCCETSQMCLFW